MIRSPRSRLREVNRVSRRSFLGVLLGFGTVVMGAALSVPLIRFALHPLLAKTTDIGWSDVGQIDEFASMTAPVKRIIKVEQRDAWRKIVSEKPVYVLPGKQRQCASAFADLPASRLFDSME